LFLCKWIAGHLIYWPCFFFSVFDIHCIKSLFKFFPVCMRPPMLCQRWKKGHAMLGLECKRLIWLPSFYGCERP
jgi:hypothetical protein